MVAARKPKTAHGSRRHAELLRELQATFMALDIETAEAFLTLMEAGVTNPKIVGAVGVLIRTALRRGREEADAERCAEVA